MNAALSLACVLLVATVPVAAQNMTVEPNIGSTSGGDIITVRGTFFLSCNFPLCPPPEFRLGGVPMVRLGPPGQEMKFATPPHPPGTVDLTTSGLVGSPRLDNAFTYVEPLDAPQSHYERILFPLAVGSSGVPGAYGSLWKTTLYALNDEAFDAEILIDGQSHALPARTLVPLNDVAANPLGILGWLQKGIANSAALSLRVRDVHRPDDGGTEIPVVREREWRNGVVTLLQIPIESTSRIALRVYAMNYEAPFLLRVWSTEYFDPLLERTVDLQSVNDAGPFPSNARTLVIGDLRAELPPLAEGTVVNVDVRPFLGDETELWAFAAITHNASQHVTLVTPQH